MLQRSIDRLGKYLPTHSIARAIDVVSDVMERYSLPSYRSEIEGIRTSYNYMFDYMANGGEDSGRADFVAKTEESLWHLADRMRRDIEGMVSADLYYAKLRAMKLENYSLVPLLDRYKSFDASLELAQAADAASVAMHADKEQALINLFNYVWVTFPLAKDELAMIADTVCDETQPRELQSQLIVALMLGALQFHEPRRLETLMDIYDRSADVAIKARALMSLIPPMYAHRERLLNDRVLKIRWKKWLESEHNLTNLRIVVLDIVHTLDTERINKSLREELIPAMRKIQPKLSQLFENHNPQEGEYNPEWEDMLRQSGLDKQMQELNELQTEGADLFMFAFSNLKNFGFFNEVSNWFLPFDPEHSLLAGQELTPTMTEIISTPGMMCDSDKYSLILSMSRIPQNQRDMLFSQLSGHEEQLREAMDRARLMMSTTENLFRGEAERYIRDMNRFLKLFREKKQFKDILRHPFKVSGIPFAGNAIMSDISSVELLSEFYLKRKYYDDAIEMLHALEKINGGDPALYEKSGYCLQQTGHAEEAMAYYRKAELFNPDSLWLIKHMASLSRSLHAYNDAMEYYGKALEREPQNTSLLMNMANMMVETGRYDDALKLYYKVNYINPEHLNSLRAIAWVEFLMGNATKSLEVHDSILLSPTATYIDLINAGHAAMLAGQIARAMENYRRAIGDDPETGLRRWSEIYMSDRQDMIKAGCHELVIDLVKDRLIHEYR